jgi:hypothetical protein
MTANPVIITRNIRLYQICAISFDFAKDQWHLLTPKPTISGHEGGFPQECLPIIANSVPLG